MSLIPHPHHIHRPMTSLYIHFLSILHPASSCPNFPHRVCHCRKRERESRNAFVGGVFILPISDSTCRAVSLWPHSFKYTFASFLEKFGKRSQIRQSASLFYRFPLCYMHNHNWSWDRFSIVFPNLMMSTCGLILKRTRVWIEFQFYDVR